jgi:PAS domain S-box-containing protein
VPEPEGRVVAAIPDTRPSAGSADPAIAVPSGAAEVIQASPDAVGIIDADLTVLAWNPAAERLYGIPAREAIGRSLRDSLRVEMPGHPDVIGQLVRPSLARNGFWTGRVVQRVERGPLAGTELIVDSTVIFVHEPGVAMPRMLVTNRDVTANARLEAEMTALASLVTATGHARTIQEVGHAALEILCRATGADSGLVASSDGSFELIATVDANPATLELMRALGGPQTDDALTSDDPYVSSDVASAPLRPEVRDALIADGLRHVVGVGLPVPGRLIGGLALGWRTTPRTPPSKGVMLQTAALIAGALENARLIGVVEHGFVEEQTLTRRMRALVELTRLPTGASVGERPLDGLLAEIGDVVGATGSLLCEVAGKRLVPVASAGLDLSRMEPLFDRPLDTLPIASRFRAGGTSLLLPVDAGSVTADGGLVASGLELRSIAAFAIRDDDRLAGVVYAVFHESVEELGLDDRTLDAIGRVLDISFANRRLRAGAEASEHRYRELFDGSPEAVLVQSIDRVVLDANPAARRLYGDDLIGRDVDELVGDGADRTTIDDAGVAHYTGTGHRLDGTTFPEEVDVRRIELGGEPRMLSIVRDLTERSRLQAELVQAQKMEAIGLLVAGVAHELNNPLASIVAFSQLLRTDPVLPEDLRTQADRLVQEANRTRTIVDNLLDFARQRPPERVATDLRTLVESTLGLQSYLLTRGRLTVAVDIPADLPLVMVDRSQLQQVLVNLTLNAAQAIDAENRPGRITIRASRVDGSADRDSGPIVRITVADDGPGIPPEILDRLFVPFVSTKPPGAGTGLGLSVSFGIIAAHGGTIRHEANADGGATFVIELPVTAVDSTLGPRMTDDRLGAAVDLAALTGPPPVPDPGAVAARVLVLDDEPSIREFLGRVLSRAGYEPVLSGSGAEALEIVRTAPPAAILCDHRMAGMNGVEFQAAVAAIDPALGRRFAFMSGDVLNPELREFATAHDVQLLAKPFDIATVGELVGSLLAAPAS